MVAEDASGVALMKKDAQSGQTMVFINGIGQSWVPYGGVHSLLGALPVLLHPNPERVALIGLGSGDTLHAMLARAETREAWSAEIVSALPQVLREAAQRPETAVVAHVLEDPSARRRQAAGRLFRHARPRLRWPHLPLSASALRGREEPGARR